METKIALLYTATAFIGMFFFETAPPNKGKRNKFITIRTFSLYIQIK